MKTAAVARAASIVLAAWVSLAYPALPRAVRAAAMQSGSQVMAGFFTPFQRGC